MFAFIKSMLMPMALLEGDGLAALLTSISSIVTQTLTWVGSVCDTIITTPLLYLSLGFFCIGAVCGLIGRMLAKN